METCVYITALFGMTPLAHFAHKYLISQHFFDPNSLDLLGINHLGNRWVFWYNESIKISWKRRN